MDNDQPVLEAVDITLGRGSRIIYKNFNITLRQGITMVLGPNGTGKTTLLEHLASPRDILDGHLELQGRPVGSDLPLRDYFARIGFLPQKWESYSGFTVIDTLEYVAWLKGLSSPKARSAAQEALVAFGLTDHAKTSVAKLSGGLQQRVGIAEAFVSNPDIVLLDEPTVGLDPEQRSLVRKYLKSNAQSKAIVVSTHLTDDVDAIADRVIVVADGVALFDGTPAELAQRGETMNGDDSPLEAGYLSIVGASAGTAS
ncbi:ABC transporter ATP-binding protein [Clavibacter sp. VKM Ac-2872]|uniref:ABC transporter ATP-binding protein n=1 Tax=Clavibacter sp. VKM Ac-2872 TaxID=2783812 RepID=UPI00188CA7EA|nr:ATP-binding cassette domain-containing protein [Clavibacter sp. VKM Ac-2872]MBF4625208.1 ATP-binding cassette domain-containing protein [Clavibacter sp. VKM Ac-2872]